MNIIEYCNRPFKDTNEMNEYIIQKWNSVVKENDIVYHLGDVGFGTTEMLKELVRKFNINTCTNRSSRRRKN